MEKKIDDGEIQNITGGMVYDATGTPEADPTKPWEVISNSNGSILGRYETRDQACWAAKQYNADPKYDGMIVVKEQVENLRAHPQS